MTAPEPTTVVVLGAEYPARSYTADGQLISEITTDGAVQAEIEQRVAALITDEFMVRTDGSNRVVRGDIQTAMAVQREISALYRVEGVVDSGINYHCTGYTPAELADLLNDLGARLEDIVRRWMCFP